MQIEESDSIHDTFEGYKLLSKLYAEENDFSSQLLLIENISNALDLSYDTESISILYNCLFKNNLKNIENFESIDEFIKSIDFKNTKNEIAILDRLIANNTDDIKRLASLRLSYIYQKGRSSALSNSIGINPIETLKYRKIALIK